MIIDSKYINLRSVEIKDAKFIYDLRSIENKTKYLSKISGSVETQKEWIKDYKKRESIGQEYYFIIESKKNEKLGLVRVYDFKDDSFSWGSWITIENAPVYTAIASALQVYEFGFYKLNFKKSHFQVSKGNDKVLSFHKKFGAIVTNETIDDYELKIDEKTYIKTKQKYKKYL
jgi:hypothetical protein